jgi:hypothetical protein
MASLLLRSEQPAYDDVLCLTGHTAPNWGPSPPAGPGCQTGFCSPGRLSAFARSRSYSTAPWPHFHPQGWPTGPLRLSSSLFRCEGNHALPSPEIEVYFATYCFIFVVRCQAGRQCFLRVSCAAVCLRSRLSSLRTLESQWPARVPMGVRFLLSRCCYSTGGLSRAHSRAAVTGTRRSSSAETEIHIVLVNLLLRLLFLSGLLV